jgi:hypothetical protein
VAKKWSRKLIDAYLEYGRRGPDKPPDEELQWAYDEVCGLIDFSDDANTALDFVLALVTRTPEPLLDWVAAGPVEDLLCHHGPAVIERVLREAGSDAKLRLALHGVWGRDRMAPEVAQQLDEFVGRRGDA